MQVSGLRDQVEGTQTTKKKLKRKVSCDTMKPILEYTGSCNQMTKRV